MVEFFLENGPMLHFHLVSKKTQCMIFWCVNFSTSSFVWCTQLQLRASIWQLIDVFLLRSMESFHRHKCFSFTEEEASVQRSNTATKWKWFDILHFYRPRKNLHRGTLFRKYCRLRWKPFAFPFSTNCLHTRSRELGKTKWNYFEGGRVFPAFWLFMPQWSLFMATHCAGLGHVEWQWHC